MVAGWREDSDRPALSPPEYLYLDSARTLAYLAQLDAGTIAREERSFAATDGIDGKVGAGGAELAVKSQRVGTVKYEVTATTTDRFYRLLGLLESTDRGGSWLHDVDALERRDELVKRLDDVDVGDFVRVTHGRMYLPPYAATRPKVFYSSRYLFGGCRAPDPPLYAPAADTRTRRALARYRRAVGKNPRLPFVLPATNRTPSPDDDVAFVLPIRYAGLASEPSSLAGEVTVVGKLIYKDTRIGEQTTWEDRESIRRYGPALARAGRALLKRLELGRVKRKELQQRVSRSMSFHPPVAVLLPVAIYQ